MPGPHSTHICRIPTVCEQLPPPPSPDSPVSSHGSLENLISRASNIIAIISHNLQHFIYSYLFIYSRVEFCFLCCCCCCSCCCWFHFALYALLQFLNGRPSRFPSPTPPPGASLLSMKQCHSTNHVRNINCGNDGFSAAALSRFPLFSPGWLTSLHPSLSTPLSFLLFSSAA